MDIALESTASSTALSVELSEGEPDERWDAFVTTCPRASVYHFRVWQKIIQGVFGQKAYFLSAASGAGDLVGVLPLIRLRSRIFGDYMVSMPYVNYGGAVGTDASVERALVTRACELATDIGTTHIEFRDTSPWRGDWCTRTDKVAMILALPRSAEDLWSALGSKVRAQIKRPQREGAEVERGGGELLEEFYAVFARNMRDLGTPVYAKEFFGAILDAFPGSSAIVLTRLKGKPVAAGFLLGFRKRLEIPWASSLREYNRMGVNMLLYWEALKHAIETGYDAFDFGRSSENSGTYRFKRQWGAEPEQLYWHYWLRQGTSLPALTPTNPKYRLAVRAWQRLPLFLANRIGRSIVKNLP